MSVFKNIEEEKSYYDELDKKHIASWGQNMEYLASKGYEKVKGYYDTTKKEVGTWYKKESLLLILVLSLFLYWTFGDWIKQKLGLVEPPKKDGLNTHIKNIEEEAKKSVLTEIQATQLAERLYDAMSDVGTDEEVIFDTLKGLNNSDFSKIYKAFGKRWYLPFSGESSREWIFGSQHFDLIQWLEAELDLKEKKKLREIAPKLGLF